MRNYKFKNLLLDNLKSNGRQLIKDAFYFIDSPYVERDTCLIFSKTGELKICERNTIYTDNVLYNFGNKKTFRDNYKPIYEKCLDNGETKDDFDTWFHDRYLQDGELEAVYCFVERRIHEIFDDNNCEVDEIFDNIKDKIKQQAREDVKEWFSKIGNRTGTSQDVFSEEFDFFVKVAYDKLISSEYNTFDDMSDNRTSFIRRIEEQYDKYNSIRHEDADLKEKMDISNELGIPFSV